MAYITLQDLIDAGYEQELIQLTDQAGLGVIDAAQVDLAIAKASGQIDNYLERRYRLPLPSVPEAVRAWALDLTRYRLYRDAPTDEVRRRYEDAMQQLKDVASKRANLSDPALAIGGAPAVAAPPRVFTADTLKEF